MKNSLNYLLIFSAIAFVFIGCSENNKSAQEESIPGIILENMKPLVFKKGTRFTWRLKPAYGSGKSSQI